MEGTLTLSSKLSPFPYAAIAIASYTQKATLNFDEAATRITLDTNGSKISSEDEIVHTLAKAGGLSGDSAKVTTIISPSHDRCIFTRRNNTGTIVLCPRKDIAECKCVPGNHRSSRFS